MTESEFESGLSVSRAWDLNHLFIHQLYIDLQLWAEDFAKS